MKKLLSIVLAVFVLLSVTLTFSACSNTVEDGVMTEVKDDSGNIIGYERRYHNLNGDISRLDVYDANQEYVRYVIYDYDDNNRLSQETTYKANGLGDHYYTYRYDDDGNVIEKGYYPAAGEALITLYDAGGNEIERYHYDSKDELYQHDVLKDGKWVIYDADDNLINTKPK